jgi:DNA-binding SARP family transcriptional activator/tetratricopeptide (TPR) repeat protein
MDYRLLGPLEVRVGDSAAPLGGKKQRSVLAVLLLRAGEVVSQDTLLDEVWGERPPPAAKAQVHNCVSRLRRALGAEALVTRAPGYVLQARPEEIDSRRFEHAVAAARTLEPAERASALWEALSMWRGPALADLAFEPFAAGEAARLEELRLVALEERIEAELELGRHTALVAELEALVARHPLRERLRGAQMLALYRSRRKPDALRAYQEARHVLIDQLGFEPSDELRALERRIHTDDPALELPVDGGPPPVALRGARRPGVVVCIEAEVVDDPEASRSLADACAAAAREAVERHGGSVQQLLGEELVAFFGLSAVHEDDALRAARAAAEIRDAYEALSAPARIGLAAGDVLTGEEGTPHAGAALRQARRLKDAAAPGAILLAPSVLRLVGPAVDTIPADPTGEAYRLLRLEPRSVSRIDTPLVGRERELARLEEVIAAVEEDRRCRRVVLVGDPGVGKSRLVVELRRRLGERALVLVGRCLAYGEAARHAALAEVLRGALAHVEPVPVELAPLVNGDAPTAPNPDLFRATRRALEFAAGDRPVVAVLEDVHWAPSMLLDLVEYLVGWGGDLPIVLVCVARPELLELRESWSADALAVEPLAEAEARLLVRSLAPAVGAARLGSVLRAADGNPLFLEQLVAFEGDPGDVPPTLETLLASRLDLLPDAERDVLRHAAVVGREFTRNAVERLLPDAAVASRLASLVRRRLVRPHAVAVGEDGFAFHHALIRDAAYASLPKARRAELHERLAAHVTGNAIVGFHLEQAYAYAMELGAERSDLARVAAGRLGDAGIAAARRLDFTEAVDLLARATRLLPDDDRERLQLACELGTAVKNSGDFARAEEMLERTAEVASRFGFERIAQRARIELIWPRVLRGGITLSSPHADGVEESASFVEQVIADFERDGDARSCERAWVCLAALRGRLQGRHADSERAAANALRYARASGFSLLAPVAMLAADACDGPMPVPEAIARCEGLLADPQLDRSAALGVRQSLAHLLAMRGDAAGARAEVELARSLHEEFGVAVGLSRDLALAAAEVDVLAGDDHSAEEGLRSALAVLEEEGDGAWAATVAGRLAELLAEGGRVPEALTFAGRAAELAQPGDIRAQVAWRRARARALGDAAGEELARQAVELLETTDEVNEQAQTQATLAYVLAREGRPADAANAASLASSLLSAKGNHALRARLGL